MPDLLTDKRILVIEDNVENMRLFRALLKLEGAQILEARGGRAGIEMAREHRPDLILMDIHMPDMDGLTATRLLRAEPATRAIPVVAVTASVMNFGRDKTDEAGCDGHIPKPIDPLTFGAQVTAFLRESAA